MYANRFVKILVNTNLTTAKIFNMQWIAAIQSIDTINRHEWKCAYESMYTGLGTNSSVSIKRLVPFRHD